MLTPILGSHFKLSLTPTALHPSAPDEATIATQEPKASFPHMVVLISSNRHGSSRSGNSPPGRASFRSATNQHTLGRALAVEGPAPTMPMGPSQRKWAGSRWRQAALSIYVIIPVAWR